MNTSFHVHPYDCHYFVDCHSNEFRESHVRRCDNPDSCANPDLGICDIDSCPTLCSWGKLFSRRWFEVGPFIHEVDV